MAVTIRDVAKKARVSVATASRTLSEHSLARRYTEQTRRKVRAAAKALGYRPNFFARQLQPTSRRMLLMCMPGFRDYMAEGYATGFHRRAAELGFNVLVASTMGREPDSFDDIVGAHGISAVAVPGSALEHLSRTTITEWADDGARIVLVNRDIDHPGMSAVLADETDGALQVAKYLYGHGARDVWMVVPDEAHSSVRLRNQAVVDWTAESGFSAPRIVTTEPIRGESAAEDCISAYESLKETLSREGAPDAIFATSDYRGFAILRALDELGLRAGVDVALWGFIETEYAALASPPLATVRVPLEQMGAAAADMLADMLEDKHQARQKMVLKPQLVPRESGQLPERLRQR